MKIGFKEAWRSLLIPDQHYGIISSLCFLSQPKSMLRMAISFFSWSSDTLFHWWRIRGKGKCKSCAQITGLNMFLYPVMWDTDEEKNILKLQQKHWHGTQRDTYTCTHTPLSPPPADEHIASQETAVGASQGSHCAYVKLQGLHQQTCCSSKLYLITLCSFRYFTETGFQWFWPVDN